jgi:hypothetical protein
MLNAKQLVESTKHQSACNSYPLLNRDTLKEILWSDLASLEAQYLIGLSIDGQVKQGLVGLQLS